MDERPDGYEVPLHQVLTEPVMTAGVPRIFCIMNMAVGFSISVNFKEPWVGVPLAVGLHFIVYQIHLADPFFLTIFNRFRRIKHFLDV
jgi:type IV secretory pathway TrbD component